MDKDKDKEPIVVELGQAGEDSGVSPQEDEEEQDG